LVYCLRSYLYFLNLLLDAFGAASNISQIIIHVEGQVQTFQKANFRGVYHSFNIALS
jgi:hypothetical protein